MLDLQTIAADRADRLAQWRAAGLYADYTYADALRDGATSHGSTTVRFHSAVRPAVRTVAQADAESDRLAAAFHSLGLGRGDVIAVMLPTWYDAALAYLAALKLGATVLPIVAIYGAREIGFILRQTAAKALVIPDRWRGHDYVARVREAGDLPALKHLMVVGEAPEGALSWDALLAHPGDDYPRGQAQADDIACILYTSGTTADPKGVKHSHNTLLCDLNAARLTGQASTPAASSVAPAATGPALSVFPAGHIAGFLGMTRPFLSGGDVIFMDQWVPEEAARLIETHKVSSTVGTPIFLSSLMEAAGRIGADLSSLERFGLGASAITPQNVKWTDQLGFPSGRTYGMTEHTVVSTSAGESFEKRAHTDGKVTPFNEVRIVDEEDRDVPVGETGEVCTRGPRLFLGYVDQELDRACFLPGGWYRSGDIGRMDAEGFLTITDRKKDIIIRGGENISAKEVEDVLTTLPGVVESAVTAMPDPAMGERVCAFVVAEPGADVTLERVREHFAAAGLARQKTPERVVLVDDLPRTPSGKVRKLELRQQLRDEAKALAG